MQVQSLGQEDPLEEGMATHSSSQYSCLENPLDRRAWAGYCPQGHRESDTTEVAEHAHTQALTFCHLPNLCNLFLSASLVSFFLFLLKISWLPLMECVPGLDWLIQSSGKFREWAQLRQQRGQQPRLWSLHTGAQGRRLSTHSLLQTHHACGPYLPSELNADSLPDTLCAGHPHRDM